MKDCFSKEKTPTLSEIMNDLEKTALLAQTYDEYCVLNKIMLSSTGEEKMSTYDLRKLFWQLINTYFSNKSMLKITSADGEKEFELMDDEEFLNGSGRITYRFDGTLFDVFFWVTPDLCYCEVSCIMDEKKPVKDLVDALEYSLNGYMNKHSLAISFSDKIDDADRKMILEHAIFSQHFDLFEYNDGAEKE